MPRNSEMAKLVNAFEAEWNRHLKIRCICYYLSDEVPLIDEIDEIMTVDLERSEVMAFSVLSLVYTHISMPMAW
jgi:hypothetical protein